MNCEQCQRRLLCVEKPGSAELAAEAHLAECAVCREFQRHLLQIEANVLRLPVPPSKKKERFLERIRGQHVQGLERPAQVATVSVPLESVPLESVPLPTRRWRPRMAWVSLTAAAVVLVAFGLWLGNQVALLLLNPEE